MWIVYVIFERGEDGGGGVGFLEDLVFLGFIKGYYFFMLFLGFIIFGDYYFWNFMVILIFDWVKNILLVSKYVDSIWYSCDYLLESVDFVYVSFWLFDFIFYYLWFFIVWLFCVFNKLLVFLW